MACTFGATAATSIGWNVGRLGHRVAGVVLSSLLFFGAGSTKRSSLSNDQYTSRAAATLVESARKIEIFYGGT